MLGNIVQTTRGARDGVIFAVVADYGGGYVTTASVTGAGGTSGELLTFDTVMGATGVTDRMQGETDFGPSAIGCFRFTIGYYGNVSHRGIPCPAGISPSAALAEARRQAAAAQTARALSVFVKASRYRSIWPRRSRMASACLRLWALQVALGRRPRSVRRHFARSTSPPRTVLRRSPCRSLMGRVSTCA
ncbi:MAG TPA: hypothetical protein VGS97_19165 [Actinocrinis sp.]|uniref:hypothetical protein n=1 Tax=Actinocrinis sp. TaxID=1920516 RepID=UPI002DDD3708|nr:hypothetical protein [Actinocrinis sp.]HEV2346228.1 hypothetical protein [Actinocrinis sp.]